MKRLLPLILVIILALPITVWAQENTEETNPEDQIMQTTAAPTDLKAQRKAEFSAARGERIKNRCNALSTKINQLASRIASIKEARARLISHKVEKLESLIQRLNDQGVDTASLSEDVATLKSMSGELDGLWAAYQTAVETLKQTKCDSDSTKEAFHIALEAAKAAMADVRTQYREIRDFFLSDIKPDLAAIRAALAADSEGE